MFLDFMLRDWLGGRWKIIIKGLKDAILGVAQALFELYKKNLNQTDLAAFGFIQKYFLSHGCKLYLLLRA